MDIGELKKEIFTIIDQECVVSVYVMYIYVLFLFQIFFIYRLLILKVNGVVDYLF